MAKSEVSIVILSDIHTGSTMGLQPKRIISRFMEGEFSTVDLCYEIEQKYSEIVKAWKGADIVVWNGDLIDGLQVKGKGKHTITPDLDKQKDWFIEVARQMEAKKNYIVYGTEYHTEKNLNVEEVIAEEMQTEFFSPVNKEAGQRADYVLTLTFPDLNNYLLNIAHHISATILPHYMFTPIGREVYLGKLEREKYQPFMEIRSHMHKFAMVFDGWNYGFVTGCFQARTPFGIKRSANFRPILGGIKIILNKEYTSYETKLWEVPAKPATSIRLKDFKPVN